MISLHDLWVLSARSFAALRLPPFFLLLCRIDPVEIMSAQEARTVMMSDSLASFVKSSLARSVLPQLIAR